MSDQDDYLEHGGISTFLTDTCKSNLKNFKKTIMNVYLTTDKTLCFC